MTAYGHSPTLIQLRLLFLAGTDYILRNVVCSPHPSSLWTSSPVGEFAADYLHEPCTLLPYPNTFAWVCNDRFLVSVTVLQAGEIPGQLECVTQVSEY